MPLLHVFGWRFIPQDTGVPGHGALCSTRPRDRSIAAGHGERTAPLLLASACDAAEAAAAIRAGADIVDLKDPRRGVLGACDGATLAAAAAARDRLAIERPLSAAIGPARDPAAAGHAGRAARLGFDYVKTGLDGVADRGEAVGLLRALCLSVRAGSAGAGLVAATYADAAVVGSLPALLL